MPRVRPQTTAIPVNRWLLTVAENRRKTLLAVPSYNISSPQPACRVELHGVKKVLFSTDVPGTFDSIHATRGPKILESQYQLQYVEF